MDKLVSDSKIIKSLENDSSFTQLFPTVDFDLLISYYNSSPFKGDWLKLAEDMSLLDCGELSNVLTKIKYSNLVYDKLNPDLIREIKELNKIVDIVCGVNYIMALCKDGNIITWGDSKIKDLYPDNNYVAIFSGDYYSAVIN